MLKAMTKARVMPTRGAGHEDHDVEELTPKAAEGRGAGWQG